MDWQSEVSDPRQFLSSLKVDLYPDEVYTFTPKGEVFAFPRGATPIDFAYRIHTDVGHRCVGARVNGKLVPLRTPLGSGDIVEILTAPNQTPSRDWLSSVVTSRARHKIRHFIHEEEKRQAVELGRRLLERELKKFKRTVRKLEAEEASVGSSSSGASRGPTTSTPRSATGNSPRKPRSSGSSRPRSSPGRSPRRRSRPSPAWSERSFRSGFPTSSSSATTI